MTIQSLLQNVGFMYRGEFSNSYNLKTMYQNMAVRLDRIRGLNPEHESVFKTSDMAFQQAHQHQK